MLKLLPFTVIVINHDLSDKEQLEKIKRHSADIPNLGDKIKCWDYEKVLKINDSLAMVNETINRLRLVPESL